MTLNLLTQVPEGLVMLCDSMVSAQWMVEGERERIAFEHARKLFHLGESLPAAAMINGDGAIGGVPLSQLLRDTSHALDAHADADHDACLKAIVEHISPVYDAFATTRTAEKTAEIEPPHFTIIVASYFDKPLASSISWPDVVRRDLVTGIGGGLWWWGSGQIPLIRLIRGVDLPQLWAEAERGDKDAAAALRYFEKNEDRFGTQMAIEIMPVQQAIYLSEYLASVAGGYDRFKVGPRTVGGEIDVVALVDRKLKWIHKQKLASSLELAATATM